MLSRAWTDTEHALAEGEQTSGKKHSSPAITRSDLAELLQRHREWIESQGCEGSRLDLSRANLVGVDLAGANLQGAILHKTNLRGADLSLADLRGASLVQANLQGADLLGTELRGADLQWANLEAATGLWIGQFAATNLCGTVLPQPVSEFKGSAFLAQASRAVRWLFAVLLSACMFSWLIVMRSTDLEVLRNSPSLPLPFLRNGVSLVGFYWAMPLFLFLLFVAFYLALQRLWAELAELPASFPDGSTLDKAAPWFLMALARRHAMIPRESRSPLSFLETVVMMFLAYWVAPTTLIILWARTLTRQDLRDTMLQVCFVTMAVGFSTAVLRVVDTRPDLELPLPRRSKERSGDGKFYTPAAVTLGTGVILSLLSLGTIYGVPHERGTAPERSTLDPQGWSASVLWAFGYSPYAELSELDISTKPVDWTEREEDLARVKGARLERMHLRHAEAYRAFLANAHLWRTDLRSAYLSEADLRRADLRETNLESAILDRARIVRANLQGANLQRANLTRADLREADLSYSSAAGAIFADARLENASLFASNLSMAILVRANLVKADLREAKLENAKLALADLRGAYLWSAKLPGAGLQEAQLEQAILIEADLRRADLRRANLRGTVLRGADFSGANLQGADLRGAVQVTGAQICSAAQRSGVQLDESLQREVENLCGTPR
jgi:uncharacterized protein YjbI with pentapeptide repeats